MTLSRSSKGFLLTLIFLAAVVTAFLVTLGGGDDDDEGEPVVVEVPEGAGASTVGDILAEKGVIRSALAFRITTRFDERASRIRQGTYELRTGMGTDAALEELSAEPEGAPTFRVTIPEGRTVTQTIEHIAEAEDSPHTVDELEEALTGVPLPEWVPSDLPDAPRPFAAYEGLLFPDTYEFRVDDDPHDVLATLVSQTESVMDDITPPDGFSRHEILTMASLIEREARIPDERRRIAAVMHNRLEEPMRLEIDATVIYANGEHLDRVLHEHLEIDSPWNTYRVDGLPPTPISGAGRAAIEAAADPADEDYLYYVVIDPETGEHGFSRTLQEHNQLRREAQQAD